MLNRVSINDRYTIKLLYSSHHMKFPELVMKKNKELKVTIQIMTGKETVI